jgi:hypothetical protein
MTELVLADGEVVDLDVIGTEINAEHDLCLLSAADAVTHGINIGKVLNKIKAKLPHGEFMPWVAKNCHFSHRQATRYIKLATHVHFDSIPESLNEALRMIAGEPAEEESNGEAEEAKPRRWTKSERERKKTVEAGGTVVANMKTDEALIEWAKSEGLYQRIDRQTDWGNPYVLEEDGDRVEVLESYGLYLNRKWGLQGRFDELRGKVLGCWCYPDACHGNILIEQLEGVTNDAERVGCHK